VPEPADPKVHPHPNSRRLLRQPTHDVRAPEPNHFDTATRYAELNVMSNFTFLTGASHPEELVEHAAALGYRAIAITDTNTLAGVVRAHLAAKAHDMTLIVGCRLRFTQPEDFTVLVYPTDRAAYARLSRLLTLGKRRAAKGECSLTLHDFIEYQDGLLAAIVPPNDIDQDFIDAVHGLRRVFDDDRLSLTASCLYEHDDRTRLAQLAALSEHTRVPLIATNDVLYHVPQRRALQDVLTCIRHGCTLDEAGTRLAPNAERYLKSPDEMARLFAEYPQAIERTIELAERASHFSLDELHYDYPHEAGESNKSPMQWLTELTWAGAADRYPQGIPEKVCNQIKHELALIDELNYAPYFLTVHDLVMFAESRGILCQGRGAAANSAVCYCLGVTAVDPDRIDVLFERFISRERNEPPDIDIDFEHERREEVIQYIYNKYGRDHAALTAEVITYRDRSAIREVGKALGLSLDAVDRLSKSLDWWDDDGLKPDRIRELGLNPGDPTIKRLFQLSQAIQGFPRHLSQHVGGFVISLQPLHEIVPIENAAMPERTVIEWDKDDIDAMGMLKVDVLGLGMLTCIRKALELVNKKATKRRSDGATEGGEETIGGGLDQTVSCILTSSFHGDKRHEQSAHVSGSGGVAAGYGTGATHVSNDRCDAGCGKIRSDEPDAPGRGLDTIQYRGRACPTESAGLSQTSANRKRITGGIVHAIRTGNAVDDDSTGRTTGQSDQRNRSHPSSTHPQSGKENYHKVNAHHNHPSSLRRSVAPSLDKPLTLSTIPAEDPAVYDMICDADTIGVFQIESRAQMTMLPRLRPRCFYDLVIEVAIVRPGPIQGRMVHPYLRRRTGQESITYPDEKVKHVLGKTLGVPLFQEQAMALAIVAAGFTPDEADQLRRTIAAWKRNKPTLKLFTKRLYEGMVQRGYSETFAEQCADQILGFSGYGFPESHAASFALLVYVSAWLKKHYPAAFAAALLNSQPMGFYAPAQIVHDARNHGVDVREVDVNYSAWDCVLEERHEERHEGTEARRHEGEEKRRSGEATEGGRKARGHEGTEARRGDMLIDSREPGDRRKPIRMSLRSNPDDVEPALRLGMRLIKGLHEADAHAIAQAVQRSGPFHAIAALRRASGVRITTLRRLAAADAFRSMGLDRQAALWHVRRLRDDDLPMFDGIESTQPAESEPANLPELSTVHHVRHDYLTTGLSLKAHPVSFIRDQLDAMNVVTAVDIKNAERWPHGTWATVAGLVLVRQRPASAKGIIFMTLEDETDISNLLIHPNVYAQHCAAAHDGVLIAATGTIERAGDVVHIKAQRFRDLTPMLADLRATSRNFR